MRRAWIGIARLMAASVVAATLSASKAVATTLPETTYFFNVTLTDEKLIITPRTRVRPGSLVVFTVRNKSSHSRNLVFGNYKTRFIGPGKQKEFELNFLVPWSFVGTSTEVDGGHKLAAKFVCTW
jgi:hypothetical protein